MTQDKHDMMTQDKRDMTTQDKLALSQTDSIKQWWMMIQEFGLIQHPQKHTDTFAIQNE